MNTQNQGTNSPSLNPVKRKRGRPRKDESPMPGENKTPSLPSGSVSAVDVDDDMVGQVVTGVIEGSFDAGYLLNVKVGSTGSNLRGVVFLPGRFSPITPGNDVAPHAKMYERKEISIPVCIAPTLFNSSDSTPGESKQSIKQNDEFKNHLPPLPSQIVPSEHKLSIPVAPEKPSGFVGTLDESLQKKGENLCMDSSLPNQVQESDFARHSVSVGEHTNCDKLALPNKVLQDFGVSTTVEGSDMEMEVKEISKSEQSSEPIGMVPDVGTIIKESQSQHLALSIVQKHDGSVDDGTKIPKLDSNQIPQVSEAELNNELGKDVIENQDSPKKDAFFQSEMGLATEITPVGLLSGAESSQPTRIVEQEDAVVVSKVATEVFYCPGLFESQPCVSSDPVSAMECDVKETIEKSVCPEFTEPQLFISAGAANNMESDVKDTIPRPPTQF